MVHLVHNLDFLVDILFEIGFLLEGCFADGLGSQQLSFGVLDQENLSKRACPNHFDRLVIVFFEEFFD